MRWLMALIAVFAAGRAGAQTLRFALDFDLDFLDPARSGSYIERVVNASLCDQLLGLDAKGQLVPELATGWEWSADQRVLTLHLRQGVLFHDGTAFDAGAVKANLDRYRTATASNRKGELKPVTEVEAADPMTVRLHLSQPYAPLLALLANRSGTMLSPRVLAQGDDAIAAHPVCAGPFRFVERVAQDHITLERFPEYWKAAAVKLTRVEFRIMPDSTIRRVNLEAGQIEIANRLAATDVPGVQANPKLRVLSAPALGFEVLSFNLAHGPAAQTPFGQDVRVRRAFLASIDREALNQIVFEGRFIASAQTESPGSPFYDPAFPTPSRDLEGAKRLLEEAGVPHPKLTLSVVNNPVDTQVGEVIQAMAAEAGFEVTLNQGESVALTDAAARGEYQAYLAIWSGRPDPDGNTSIWLRCGAPLNWGGWCSRELDAALDRGAAALDPAARRAAYHDAAAIWMRDVPWSVLYHFTWFWGASARVEGAAPRPDGIIRLVGVSLAP